MYSGSFFLMNVRDLVQSTVANQSTVWQSHIGLFANYRCLDFHDLCDMIRAGLEFVCFDTVVNSHKNVFINVTAIINTSKIFDKVLEAHSALGLEIWCVQIGVEHYNGERKHKYSVRGTKPRYDVGVTLAVALTKHFHQSLDLLSLAWHSEVRLELS